MGASGGKKAQTEARTDPLASDETLVDSVKTKCKTVLKVKVLRSDDDKGIQGIKVKALFKKKAPLKRTSVAKTGLADFGEVKAGTYDIELDLGKTDLEKYRQHGGTRVKVAKNRTTTITVKLMPLVDLRIVLLGFDRKDRKDKTLGRKRWRLEALEETKGSTKTNGLIKAKVPILQEEAKLHVVLGAPPPPPRPEPPVVTTATDYPIKIDPSAWIDRDEEPTLPQSSHLKVDWTLSLVDLADLDNDDGIKSRLHNLAFQVGDGKNTDVVKHAVNRYQATYLATVDGSGALSDVEDDVKKRHDKL